MSEVNRLQQVAGPEAATPKRPRKRIWLWVAIAGLLLAVGWCVLLAILAGAFSMPGLSRDGLRLNDAVGVIYVEGTIGLSGSSSIGMVNSEAILDYFDQAESDGRVKAIVVYINSPGGAVVASDEMYHALREASKPVVAAMGDVAASGGYYVACGADKIIAHPATLTGSIGVFGRLINAADLLETLGIEGIIIRSGENKAAGNWFEHPTEEQLAIEQAIVDELYDLFVSVVSEGRGIEEARVRELADGRAYTGQQALELGLVDELGSLRDAIEEAARMGRIDGEPQIIEYRHTPSLFELWFASRQEEESPLSLLERLDSWFWLPQMRYARP